MNGKEIPEAGLPNRRRTYWKKKVLIFSAVVEQRLREYAALLPVTEDKRGEIRSFFLKTGLQ
jgi:hypothetical protein